MKLNKLKLNEIAKNNLTHREMRHVVGGGSDVSCICACAYAGSGGGSSVADNCGANAARGLISDGSSGSCIYGSEIGYRYGSYDVIYQ